MPNKPFSAGAQNKAMRPAAMAQIVHAPVSSLQPNPLNPRMHDRQQVRAIARSIQAFGFNAPILISGDRQVVAGHGRLEAAKLLGLAEVPVVQLGHLSDAQAKAYMLADNKLTDRSTWDERELALRLQGLQAIALDFEIEATGFEPPEIDFRVQALEPSDVADAADEFELQQGPAVSVLRHARRAGWRWHSWTANTQKFSQAGRQIQVMSDYEIGYGKPPKAARFKAGSSGNPKGRPKRKPLVVAEVISDALNARMQYQEQGQTKSMPRLEVALKALVDSAVRGDLDAADNVLGFRIDAERFGDVGVERLEVSDWLPDYAGQTVKQKTQEHAGERVSQTPGRDSDHHDASSEWDEQGRD